jgi:hypothetical protein
LVERLRDAARELYDAGDSTSSMVDPIAVLLEAADEIERLEAGDVLPGGFSGDIEDHHVEVEDSGNSWIVSIFGPRVEMDLETTEAPTRSGVAEVIRCRGR